MRIIHGRPRHPQTQGLIERANAILTDALEILSNEMNETKKKFEKNKIISSSSKITTIDDRFEFKLLNITENKIETSVSSRHELHRTPARLNYLKSQNKRQKLYDDHIQKLANSYKNGDLVGVSINKVDRTNCDPKLIPCIIEKRSDNKSTPTYYLISPYGRLSIPFPIHQLIPMSGIKPTELQHINMDDMPTITLVQASKLFARGNPAATCDCKTRCVTKTCPCRRASISCSTKCHAKVGKCFNIDE